MKTEDLIRYVEPKRKVKIFLTSGGIYTGFIEVVGEDSILFKERDGKDLMISTDFIKFIEPLENSKKTPTGRRG